MFKENKISDFGKERIVYSCPFAKVNKEFPDKTDCLFNPSKTTLCSEERRLLDLANNVWLYSLCQSITIWRDFLKIYGNGERTQINNLYKLKLLQELINEVEK